MSAQALLRELLANSLRQALELGGEEPETRETKKLWSQGARETGKQGDTGRHRETQGDREPDREPESQGDTGRQGARQGAREPGSQGWAARSRSGASSRHSPGTSTSSSCRSNSKQQTTTKNTTNTTHVKQQSSSCRSERK